jgi:23S rRNA (guanosine2251-2'-O)-methyltransferase
MESATMHRNGKYILQLYLFDTSFSGSPRQRNYPMAINQNAESSTVVYGIHAVEALLSTRLETIDHIYFENGKRSLPLFNLLKVCRKERLSYNLVPPQKLAQLAGTDKHQGVIALCSVKPYGTIEELKKNIAGRAAPLFMLAASVEDPGNLGALVRSCVAFSVDALFLERKNTAPLSPAVAKSSAGMVEHLAILRPKNLEGIVRDFALSGYKIIGAHAEKGSPPSALDLTGPTMIVLGGEHRGIPPYLDKLCTGFASIPIDKKAQSLNVASAGAVLLYECGRQRAKRQSPRAPEGSKP